MSTPDERMAAGYAEHNPDNDATLNAAKAKAFDPDFEGSAEQLNATAERLAAKGVDLPPNLRLQLGYHNSAKAAAAATDQK